MKWCYHYFAVTSTCTIITFNIIIIIIIIIVITITIIITVVITIQQACVLGFVHFSRTRGISVQHQHHFGAVFSARSEIDEQRKYDILLYGWLISRAVIGQFQVRK